MSINHIPQEKLATFHAMNQSAIGIDVHSNLIVGVYQSSRFNSPLMATHGMEILQRKDLKTLPNGAKSENQKFC